MSLENRHPEYELFQEDWITLRDCYGGERKIKAKGTAYLPATAGMKLDGMKPGQQGKSDYDSYLLRAVFPDYVKEGVELLVGMMHHKEPTIELPPVMEPLRAKCTLIGESLTALLRRINTEQLTTGRIGLLADMPAKVTDAAAGVLPYIAPYVAESVINWDNAAEADNFEALNLVVLDESGFIREADFSWKELKKFRVLLLGDELANETRGVYTMGTFADERRPGGGSSAVDFDPAGMSAPTFRGKALKEIPFVIINTKDITAHPDDAPLIGLARLCLTIYRGEADYRQGLYLSGQDTLVVIGGTSRPDAVEGQDGAIRTGAGSRIDLDLHGDAKFIGVSATGLPEQRTALENDRKLAETKAGHLVASGKASQRESGEALSTRLTAQTATLTQMARTGALGLENLLKIMARWIGADENKVKVTPNLEFGDTELAAKSLLELMTARQIGLPLSRESIHKVCVDRGLTGKTFDEEMATMEEEDATMPMPGIVPAGTSDAESDDDATE